MISTKNKKGMTLTELIVASILIGIVMLGVASFSVSIQQFQKTTNLDTVLSMKAMAAMSYLVKDAYLLTGEESDRGIEIRDINPFKSICFRHNSDGGDPGLYDDDEYVCYLFETNNNNRKFARCTAPTPLSDVPPNNANKCGGGARNILATIDPAVAEAWVIQEDADGRFEYIEFTISAIFDPTTAAHPITNPVYTLTTRVSPPALSR